MVGVRGADMVKIEVDRSTARSLEFAASIAGVTAGEVVARLVAQSSMPKEAATGSAPGKIAIHADYEGIRSNALFDAETERVDFVEGPLAGKSFKSPSGAAVAVVKHYKPDVDPNRNGWGFWTVTETGEWLQALRRSPARRGS